MISTYRCLAALLLALTTPILSAHADNWPQFRGADMNPAVPDNSNLPEHWSTTENVEWVIDIPGLGWSSPIVWGNKVFLTTVDAAGEWERPKSGLYNPRGRAVPVDQVHAWIVYCFDLETGKILWEKRVHEAKPTTSRHPKNTYASETPATDGERVYFLFGDIGLFAFDMDGNEVWRHEIDPQKTMSDWGPAGSPIIHDGNVIMTYDNMENSWIAAFDGKTGDIVWRTERDEVSSWATPYVWENDIRTEIVTNGKNRIRSYDEAGKLLWEMDGRMSWACIATPLSNDNLVFVNSGYFMDKHRPVYAIKAGASGDITLGDDETSSEFVAWYQPLAGNYNTSPLIYQDLYYSILDRGTFECYNPATGELVFTQKKIAPSGRTTFTVSPWAYNGKIFCLSEQGETYVVEAGSEFNLLHQNSLDEMCMSSPAITEDSLIIRTISKLYRIKNK